MNQAIKNTAIAVQSFEEVYAEYIGLVQYVISKFYFSSQVKEEIIQEVFLRYLENRSSLVHSKPKYFLITVARNLAIDCYREEKRRNVDGHVPMEDVMHELPQGTDGEYRSQLLVVQEFLKSLKNDPQASTLVQYYDEDLSIKEIAARSHVPIATVSSRLSRQRQRYRARLEKEVQAVRYSL